MVKIIGVINDDLRQKGVKKELSSWAVFSTITLGYMAIECNNLIRNEKLVKSDLWEALEGVKMWASIFLSTISVGKTSETYDKLHRLK